MKKILLGITTALLMSSLFVSCASTGEYHEAMLPYPFVSFTDLNYNEYDYIGNVTGSSTFTVDGDLSNEYSSYVGVLNIYGASEEISYDTNLDEAIKQAVYDMTKKAKQLNANMLILPSYSFNYVVNSTPYETTTVVTVSVSAVAVKLIDKSGNSLEVF